MKQVTLQYVIIHVYDYDWNLFMGQFWTPVLNYFGLISVRYIQYQYVIAHISLYKTSQVLLTRKVKYNDKNSITVWIRKEIGKYRFTLDHIELNLFFFLNTILAILLYWICISWIVFSVLYIWHVEIFHLCNRTLFDYDSLAHQLTIVNVNKTVPKAFLYFLKSLRSDQAWKVHDFRKW